MSLIGRIYSVCKGNKFYIVRIIYIPCRGKDVFVNIKALTLWKGYDCTPSIRDIIVIVLKPI